jgi:hypothetical protein
MKRCHLAAGLGMVASLALALAGCGPTAAPERGTQQAGAARSPSILRGDPRLTVAHTGIRRIEHPRSTGPARSFRERITTDGQGRYSIEPLDALAGSAADWQTFELLQRAREGFLFRYRDFLVRDPRLFERNWRTVDLGRTALVAGRSCALYRVDRLDGAATTFELSIDAGTGLVLASQERDAGGELVAAMTYESLDLHPDSTGTVWHVPSNEERVVDPLRSDLFGEIGAEPLRPRLLPPGYGPLETATVGDGQGRRWFKLTYSDGIEPLFFFQALEDGLSGSVQGATPHSGARLGHSPSPSSVSVFQVGAATAIQGTVDGRQLIVIGKAPKAELLDLIESSLP